MFELLVGYAPFQGEDDKTVKYNISRLKIRWPNEMDRDAADLISKILKYNPEERISLEQILLHPFFTKYYPNAISCLKIPDNTQYRVFIVSKDNPLIWNPVYDVNDYNLGQNNTYTNNYTNLNQYNYNNLLEKYDNLQKEYDALRSIDFSSNTINSLRKELREKEEKINILSQSNNGSSYNYINNNDLRATYNELVNENYDLKNTLNLYENQYNNQNNFSYLDNHFNDIRNSIAQNNKNDFNAAINRLQNDIDTYTQNDYNTILMMKDREIEKWKEEESMRREREKQEFKAMINKYDQSLTMGERENHELKMRLKELQGYFV